VTLQQLNEGLAKGHFKSVDLVQVCREISIGTIQLLTNVQAYLNRITEVGPTLNAVTEINPDALKIAEQKDKERLNRMLKRCV
jgi:Asp-tRNA(Asn)/Glu-tRNA(Gln) amidotransferase A subunit family amidase